MTKPDKVLGYTRHIGDTAKSEYSGRRNIYFARRITKGNDQGSYEVLILTASKKFGKFRLKEKFIDWIVDIDDYITSTNNKLPHLFEGRLED